MTLFYGEDHYGNLCNANDDDHFDDLCKNEDHCDDLCNDQHYCDDLCNDEDEFLDWKDHDNLLTMT